MEIPVKLQILQMLAALAAGFAVGIVHDFLAMLRLRRSRIKAAVLDGILCAIIWIIMFSVGMWAGAGRQRIFLLVFAVIGAAGYLMLLAPFIRPLLGCTADAAGWVMHVALYPFNRLFSGAEKLLKMLALFISTKYNDAELFSGVKKRGTSLPVEAEGDNTREEKAYKYFYGARPRNADRIYDIYADGTLHQNIRRKG